MTVGIGQVVCEESGAVNKEMREVTSAVTVDITSDLDTGSEASSTTYYVYAIGDADATTFTCKMSTSSTSPTGLTCFRLLGEFRNGTDGHIDQNSVLSYATDHMAAPQAQFGAWATAHEGTAYAVDTAYQAATDGFVIIWTGSTGAGGKRVRAYTDSSNPPTTQQGDIFVASGSNGVGGQICMPVKKGDYWKYTSTMGTPPTGGSGVSWMPLK
ncbi:hypothetical protein LCGC14_2588900 [marine sediment metagenome]|uniref:Uncharacterized protein n=1 Tax=marine sediment metagenome TaxID=412755 RepID=A0A0F9ACJ3_9ZZZZ